MRKSIAYYCGFIMNSSENQIKSALEKTENQQVTANAMLSSFILVKAVGEIAHATMVSGVIFVEKSQLIMPPKKQLPIEIVSTESVRPVRMLNHTADVMRSKLHLARISKQVAFIRLTIRETFHGKISTELGPLGPTGSQVVVACIDFRADRPRIMVYNPTGSFPFLDFQSLLESLAEVRNCQFNQNFQSDQSYQDEGLGALFCHRVLWHWFEEVKNQQRFVTLPLNSRITMLNEVASSIYQSLEKWPHLKSYAGHF